MVYNRWSWKVLWILFVYGKGQFWKLNGLIAEYSEAQTGCPVTYSYSRAGGRRWLAEHGFRTTDVMVDHIFPYRIPDYVQYRYKSCLVFPLDAQADVPRPRARLRLAPVSDGEG